MKRRAASTPSTPIGTLMKKIQLQLTFSVRRPPTSGPIASASAETPAQIPIAAPRRRGGKVAVMIESVARRAGEDQQPSSEDRPPPEQIRELASREQQYAKGERVGVDDPLELGDRDPEIGADRRQRDVH